MYETGPFHRWALMVREAAPIQCRAVLAVPLVVAALACSEPLEFADWTLPVEEATSVREYADVPDEEREGQRVELVRDLVIGDSGAPEETFYQPFAPAVDGEGRIYVLDRGNHRVQVFDADGEFLVSFGNEGQGPGELASPSGIAAVGNEVLIADRSNSRISVHTREGVHVEDVGVQRNDFPSSFIGTDDGNVLVSFYPSIPLGVENPEPYYWKTLRRTRDFELAMEYISLPFEIGTFGLQELEGGRRRFMSVPMSSPIPRAALSPSGRVYATASDQYQVLALGDEGQHLWALRVARPAEVPSEAQIDSVLTYMRQRYDNVTRDQINWPEQHPAISSLQLDGDGNLYVFPYVFHEPALEGEEPFDGPYPVDVYDADGERLFAGTIDIPSWSAALGEHLYRLETDPATDEPIVVRYRVASDF